MSYAPWQRLFKCFNELDSQGISDIVSEDIVYRLPGEARITGRKNLVKFFEQDIFTSFDSIKFTPRNTILFENGGVVVEWDVLLIPKGKSEFRSDGVSIFISQNDRLCEVREYYDTANVKEHLKDASEQ